MSASLHLVQAQELAWQFDPVPQRAGRCLGFFYRLAASFPLPGATAVERLAMNAFASRGDVNPHPAWPRGVIDGVHFKTGIDNVQRKFDGLDSFNRRAPAHSLHVMIDQLIGLTPARQTNGSGAGKC